MSKRILLGERKCFITLSFDDGYKETIDNVLPLLNKFGIKASFNVITGLIGKKLEGKELANWNDLEELANNGHEICSHSVSHAMLNLSLRAKSRRLLNGFLYSNDKFQFLKRCINFYKEIKNDNVINIYQFEEEVKKSKEDIESMLNIPCISWVYPHGNYTEPAKDIIKKYGYISARSSDRGFNDPLDFDKFCLKIQQWDKYTSVSEANRWVDNAERNSLWLIECLHLVTKKDDEYPFHTKLHDLENHLKYLKEKKNCVINTQKAVISILRDGYNEV